MSIEDPTEYARYILHDSSGSINWAIGFTVNNAVRVRSGMSGHTVKLTELPAASPNQAEVLREKLVGEKLNEGYRYAGMAVVKKGRLEPMTAGASKPSELAPLVLWEIQLPLDRARMLERLHWAVEKLQRQNFPVRVEFDATDGICRVYDQQAWEFGYSDLGGIAPDGRGGGGIQYQQGIIPLLILTFLQRSFPAHLKLASAQNAVLQPVLSTQDPVFGNLHYDPEQLIALGACLELCISRTRLLSLAAPEQGSAVWI